MVLQRGPQQAVVWGVGPGGAVVTVALGSVASASAIVGSDNTWVVRLGPLSASATPLNLIVFTPDHYLKISDVLVGDVWVCGGQSNMQFTTGMALNGTASIAAAAQYPHVRLFTAGQGTTSSTPLDQLQTIEQPWTVASPASVGGPDWLVFSAVCWLFGQQLYDRVGVPIGLVSSNWGGTVVEAWSPPDALGECRSAQMPICGANPTPPELSLANKFHQRPDAIGPNPNSDSALWNAMIAPFLLMRITGVIWYQGESNVFDSTCYECAFPAMIRAWRRAWAPDDPYPSGAFPFLFVQLAAYISGDPDIRVSLPGVRRSQEMAQWTVENTGMASAIDLGDLNSPYDNIHPRNKTEVARRLVLQARRLVYGEADVVADGPRAMAALKASNGVIEVAFSTPAQSLRLVNNTCPPTLDRAQCGAFQAFTAHFLWEDCEFPKLGSSSPTSVHVQCDPSASLLRYAFAEWPLAVVYDSTGLPASPFVLPVVSP